MFFLCNFKFRSQELEVGARRVPYLLVFRYLPPYQEGTSQHFDKILYLEDSSLSPPGLPSPCTAPASSPPASPPIYWTRQEARQERHRQIQGLGSVELQNHDFVHIEFVHMLSRMVMKQFKKRNISNLFCSFC